MSTEHTHTADDLDQSERDRLCWQLRIAGHSYAEIAAEVGYAGPSGAYQAAQRAMSQTYHEPPDELRTLEAARLDQLEAVMMATVVDEAETAASRTKAVGMVLRIMERRTKLLGLDAPTRIQQDVTTWDTTSEQSERMQEIMAEMEAMMMVHKRLDMDTTHDEIMATIQRIEDELRETGGLSE